MTWFKNWFDSPYYHLLYKNRNEEEAKSFIDNLINYLQIPNKSKVLDIACGKGRHSIYFNKKGMNVTGIDLSHNNINFAKTKENLTLKFAIHDMRKIFKRNKFDIAVNLFTSFGYFKKNEDEKKSLNAMAKNLKSGGILIIDFMNVKKITNSLVKYEKKKINGVTFEIKRSLKDNFILKDIFISDKGENYKFQEKVKALTLIDFSKLISKAGLNIINIFGNYKLDHFNASISDRLIIVCKK